MFAVRDIETLRDLAAVLTIPFFSTASIIDGLVNPFQDPILNSLRNSSHDWLVIVSWMLLALITVAVIALAFHAIDQVINWLDIRASSGLLMPWVGFTFLTGGAFIFCHVFPSIQPAPLNPFWHLGFFAYGLDLIDRASQR